MTTKKKTLVALTTPANETRLDNIDHLPNLLRNNSVVDYGRMVTVVSFLFKCKVCFLFSNI